MTRKTIALVVLIALIISSICISPVYAAQPTSTNYQIRDYSFGSGGVNNATSANYGLTGNTGEVEFGRPVSLNYKAGSGLNFMTNANVPAAPTFTNPNSTYNRLHFVLNPGTNPADYTYALQISTDSTFTTNLQYVKSDGTLGPTLALADFKTYTNWGGTNGTDITDLPQNQTYYLRVKSRQGNYTESEYGPSATATTLLPSLTFSVDKNAIVFSNLNATNAYTDTNQSTTVTTSTNAANGYIVTAYTAGALSSGAKTIPDYAGTNATPTSWAGYGMGYTTSDTNVTGGTADRFTNGGPKYAGFTTAAPGDPVADHAGPVTTPISNESFTISYRIQTSNTQPAATYKTTVFYTVVPSY